MCTLKKFDENVQVYYLKSGLWSLKKTETPKFYRDLLIFLNHKSNWNLTKSFILNCNSSIFNFHMLQIKFSQQ